jgi:hypothetical protein
LDLKPVKEEDTLYLTLIGGVRSTVNVLGFPVKQVIPLTDYSAAARLLEQLKKRGVSSVSLQYLSWQNGADRSTVQSRVSPDAKLGGKKELRNLIEYCTANRVSFYPDFNLTDIVQKSWSYNTQTAAKSIQKQPAMEYRYRLSDGSAYVTEAAFLLAPRKLETLAEKINRSADRWSLQGLSASTLGYKLYSDFGPDQVSRDTAEKKWQDSLSALRAGEKRLLLSAACGYALPYAAAVTNTPSASSGFSIETEAIPFYQIALRGIIPMATTPVNASGNTTKALLFAAECGISPNYRLLNENEKYLKDSALYADVTNGKAADWIEDSIKAYQTLSPLLTAVSGQTIAEHETLQDGVRRTVFSNGISVTVNYTDAPVEYGNRTIEALSFYWEG